MPKYLRFCLCFRLSVISKWQLGWFWKKINIYNFYVYHQITIGQICIIWLNGNSVVHMNIVNIYLFPKLTELQFDGPQICQIAIHLITLKLKCKLNLRYSECTSRREKHCLCFCHSLASFFMNWRLSFEIRFSTWLIAYSMQDHLEVIKKLKQLWVNIRIYRNGDTAW